MTASVYDSRKWESFKCSISCDDDKIHFSDVTTGPADYIYTPHVTRRAISKGIKPPMLRADPTALAAGGGETHPRTVRRMRRKKKGIQAAAAAKTDPTACFSNSCTAKKKFGPQRCLIGGSAL